MFERFTESSRRAVVLAQEEASRLRHNYIGTEHLLLGVLHEGEGVGATALAHLGITLQAVRDSVEEMIGTGDAVPARHIPFTPRAKKVLELALRHALDLKHNHIGTEHILLGLIREGEGVAAQVLIDLGADLPRLRRRVLELLDDVPRSAGAGATGFPMRSESGIPMAPPGVAARACSFCGRDVWETQRHVQSRTAVICDRCVASSQRAIEETQQDPSRPLHLPPRVFAPQVAFDQSAVDGIVHAFGAVFGGTEDDEERARLLEDGPALAPLYHDVIARIGDPWGLGVLVERIRFLDDDSARVGFAILIGTGVAFPFDGRALRSGQGWQVSRATFCHALARAGVRCPPPA